MHRSAAVGGSAAGFPAGKRPHPSPGLFETLNRNRRQEAPGRPGSGPSPDFPPGWGRNDSTPSPFPRFPCLHFSSRPRGGRCSGPQPLARHPRRRGPGSQPKGAPVRQGFSGPGLPLARLTQGSRLRPSPVPSPAPAPAPFPTVRPGASSPRSRSVAGREEGGPRRGCDSSRPDQCQLQPRFSARCQLALSSGTEGRLGAPCRWGWGNTAPQVPSFPPTQDSQPSLARAALAAGPARNWPAHFAWDLQQGLAVGGGKGGRRVSRQPPPFARGCTAVRARGGI